MKKEEKDFGFKNLVLWQKSMNFVNKIYELTKSFPFRQDKALVSQLTRAAISIPANIAEGSFRRSKMEFVQFLYVAKGSLAESITFLELALGQKYINETAHKEIISQSKEILTLLVALINSLRKEK